MAEKERRQDYKDMTQELNDLNVCVKTNFAQLSQQHEFFGRTLEDLRKSQEQVVHTLHGNGKEGLITTVARIKQRVGFIWAIFSVIGGGLVATGFYMLRTLV